MLIQSGLSEQIFEFHPLDGDMGSLMGGGVTLVGGKKLNKFFFFKFDFFSMGMRLYVSLRPINEVFLLPLPIFL